MKGKYARNYASSCSFKDRSFFHKMERNIPMNHRNIWVRKVEIGDIITSRDGIIRWKFIEDKKTGDLYLGFIEERNFMGGYKHGDVALYHVELDYREESSQKYMLYRIRSGNTAQIYMK